jgi:hypothetical protein
MYSKLYSSIHSKQGSGVEAERGRHTPLSIKVLEINHSGSGSH